MTFFEATSKREKFVADMSCRTFSLYIPEAYIYAKDKGY